MKVQEYLRNKNDPLQALATLKEELGIRYKVYEEDGIVILDYDQIESPKTHPIVIECRSLILSYPEFDVVSRKYDRFFNYGEAPDMYADFSFDDAVVMEKADGSLIGVYHNPKTDRWEISTRGMASGMSIFWVSKHTSTRTVANHGTQNLPLTVTGDSTVNVFNGFGFSGGELGCSIFTSSFVKTYRGSGYNDGTARLYGWTWSTAGDLKAYVNGAQVGATATGITYYGSLQNAWCAIGSGYRAETTGDIYGGDDGFDGLLGPVVVVNGVISGADLADLVTWSQQQGWVP